jgi:predicted DNA-binding transcriptional regulator YafY
LDVLPYLLAPTTVAAAQRSAAGPDAAGWTVVTIPIESAEAALPELLKLGADAEIVSPDDLRARVVQTLRAMNSLYAP